MFYSQCLLSRKGPLGAIWVAAYCHKRLKKGQVAETDISSSVDEIMLNEVTVTYRVLGYLLLGVVRIYSKKVEYLFHDCNEILIKINTYALSRKDIPPKEAMCAPHLSITLPDNFELDAFDLEILEDVSGGSLRPHQQITLEETWEDAGNEHYSLDKLQYHHEDAACFEIISTVYTPVEDALSPHIMDIDMVVSPSDTPSGLEASMEKLQFNQLPQEECPDLEMFCGAEEPLDIHTQFDEVCDQLEQIKFLEMTPLDPGKPDVLTDGHPAATIADRTPDEPKFPYYSGAATPEFMVIPTPAKKEQLRISRKRKHLFDDTIVVSNEVFRQSLHDSSSLVGKRRKAPQTALDAWKACKISNLCQDFLEPLIPCISSQLKALFYKKNFNCTEPVEAAECPFKSGEEGLETPSKSSAQKAFPEKNFVEHSASVRFVENPTTSKSDKVEPLTSVASVGEELSAIETQDLGLNLADEELVHHEEDNQNLDGWTIRTRTVARFMCKSFLNQKERREKEVLNVEAILDGRTRKESSRLFYEILVLKSKGFVDVKQDTPYGDILVLTTPQIKEIV